MNFRHIHLFKYQIWPIKCVCRNQTLFKKQCIIHLPLMDLWTILRIKANVLYKSWKSISLRSDLQTISKWYLLSLLLFHGCADSNSLVILTLVHEKNNKKFKKYNRHLAEFSSTGWLCCGWPRMGEKGGKRVSQFQMELISDESCNGRREKSTGLTKGCPKKCPNVTELPSNWSLGGC